MRKQKMRKPKIENKYNLKPRDIENAVVLDKDKITKEPFWRNDIIHAWCLSGGAGKGLWGGYENEYWIGFYDEDAPSYAGKIKMYCTSYEGMCGYNFKEFFKLTEMQIEDDLVLQEKLLETYNWLIDDGILTLERDIQPHEA